MDKLFLTLSFLAMVAGFIFLSEATTGVGIIALAGVFAVWARIFQAQAHHKDVVELMLRKSKQESDS